MAVGVAPDRGRPFLQPNFMFCAIIINNMSAVNSIHLGWVLIFALSCVIHRPLVFTGANSFE